MAAKSSKHIAKVSVVVSIIVLIVIGVFLFTNNNGRPEGPEEPPREAQRQLQASGEKGAVASDVDVCSRAGVDALKEGGSAVDAAIVAQLCVEVINLQSSGIGGGGFMLVYNSTDGSAQAVDCRETVPSAFGDEAVREAFEGGIGVTTIGTPGALLCYKRLHDMYGRLPWPRLFQPSIDLAETGFRVTRKLALSIEQNIKRRWPMSRALHSHLLPNGEPARHQQVLTRPQFAATLRQIVESGPDAFYRGPIGLALVRDVQAAGGHLSLDDLASYEEVLRQPVEANVFRHRVLSVGPPTSGSVVIFALKMLEELRTRSIDEDADAWQRVVEILRFAFVQRARIGDPAFSEVNRAVGDMLDDGTARTAAELIDRFVREKDGRQALDVYQSGKGPTTSFSHHHPTVVDSDDDNNQQPADDFGTSGASVIDSSGLACASFISINYAFGSGFMSPSTGILLNNHLDDFDSASESPNRLEPAARQKFSVGWGNWKKWTFAPP